MTKYSNDSNVRIFSVLLWVIEYPAECYNIHFLALNFDNYTLQKAHCQHVYSLNDFWRGYVVKHQIFLLLLDNSEICFQKNYNHCCMSSHLIELKPEYNLDLKLRRIVIRCSFLFVKRGIRFNYNTRKVKWMNYSIQAIGNKSILNIKYW